INNADSGTVNCRVCCASPRDTGVPAYLRINLEIPLNKLKDLDEKRIDIDNSKKKLPEFCDNRRPSQSSSFKNTLLPSIRENNEAGNQTQSENFTRPTESGSAWLRTSLRMRNQVEAMSRVVGKKGELDWDRLEELESKTWTDVRASGRQFRERQGSFIDYLKILFTTIEKKMIWLSAFMPKIERLHDQLQVTNCRDNDSLYKLMKGLMNLKLLSRDLEQELLLLKNEIFNQAVFWYELNQKFSHDPDTAKSLAGRKDSAKLHFARQLRVLIEVSSNNNKRSEFCLRGWMQPPPPCRTNVARSHHH
ncbi:hypothetical protein Ciccas_012904, partial [Cichlidogyrus casuarinus]